MEVSNHVSFFLTTADFNKIPAKEGSQLRLFQELKSESTKMAFSLIIAWP